MFKQMKKYKEDYPNYIYALTMDLARLFLWLLAFSMSFCLQRNTQRIKDFVIMHWYLHQIKQFWKTTLRNTITPLMSTLVSKREYFCNSATAKLKHLSFNCNISLSSKMLSSLKRAFTLSKRMSILSLKFFHSCIGFLFLWCYVELAFFCEEVLFIFYFAE